MTSAPTAALTYLVAGQTGAHERQLARFDDNQWQEYLDLLSGLFVLTAERRFRPGEPAAVIRFVASVRERFDPAGTAIDPTVAETLMYAALGQHDTLPATAETITTQTLLVVALVTDEGLSPAGLADLIDDTTTMIALQSEPAELEKPPEAVDPAPAEEADLPAPDTTADDDRAAQQ
ncbi:hypothetical protein O7621_24220 [Solwaraspora sp. WMMD937]|uniref:hypothetical protein n=1 Tax=Solwaraspora sp. WMMD937 TaxID=3016090 RepID=UPI002499DB2F|nr:hypothetical protein [Solwaraspora sp. WMMD937]WFE20942.1 hypothetical protein O7621_24220 [Solwaraspora sp. WMMD937]